VNNNILDYRIKRNNRYQLLETVENISNDHVLLEGGSIVGSQIHRIVTTGLMALLDDATGELSGMIAVLPLLYKNVYEIHTSNKAVERFLQGDAVNVDTVQLKELRQDLIKDVSDIVNAIVLALPIPIIDAAGIAFFNMLEGFIIGKGSASFLNLVDGFQDSNPTLSKILEIIAYPFGGNVIYKGLRNISMINDIIDIDMQKKDGKTITERWEVLSGIN
tara:strand:- start:5580 stop:6236 length:657 start_codon:yes stop_codon:yes gene_type:complete